jgi:protocatechuate 3,4-dioxygenase beta subunit
MFDFGNFLNTNLATSIDYTGRVVPGDGLFGAGSTYFTRKNIGLFALSAQNIDITEFEITGNTGANGSGTADGVVIPLKNGFVAFVKRVFGSSKPSINHIVIVPDNGSGQSQTFSTNTDNDQHLVMGLDGVNQLHYLLVASAIGGFIDDGEIRAIAEAFIDTSGLSTEAHVVRLDSEENATGLDFGNRAILPSAINGSKWNDLDHDGQRDANEPGVEGWTIFLDANGDGGLDADEQSTLTNINGDYSFAGLTMGNYLVAELPKAGWEQTFPVARTWNVTVGNGETVVGVDFGNYEMQPGSISGTKWDDGDGDGKYDEGEGFVAGVTIYLDANRNGSLDNGELADVTNADGSYEFSGLMPDAYVVREVVPSGFTQTFPLAESETPIDQILAALNANFHTVNSLIPNRFDFFDGVSGTRIQDGGGNMYDNGNILNTNLVGAINYTGGQITDGDGLFGTGSIYFTRKYPGLFTLSATNIDITEFQITGYTGIYGVGFVDGFVLPLDNGFTAFVKRAHGGSGPSVNHIILVPGNGSQQAQTFSNSAYQDQHHLTGLAGVNELHYLLVASTNGEFINDNEIRLIAEAFVTASGIERETGGHALALASGETATGLNFGNQVILPSTISGTKWSDLNQNGQREAGEPGLAGWTIFVDANGNGALDVGEARTETNTNGDYSLTGLTLGNHLVVELNQTGWKQTFPVTSTWDVALGNGELASGIDFGNHKLQTGTISGTKWDDADGDGVFDTRESLVAGVTIFLDSNSNGSLDNGELTQVTDEHGAYEFTGLLPDVYLVREVVPNGFEQTFPRPSDSLSQVLSNLNANVTAITSLIPERFDFTEGVTGSRIQDGGNDMFDYGNYLETNLSWSIDYTGGMIKNGERVFGAGSSYFTQKLPGLFVLSARNIDITEFQISGSGANSGGTVDGIVIPLGNGYTAFVKRNYGSASPSINHIILVPGNGSAQNQSFSPYSYSDHHAVSGLDGVSEFHYLLFASRSGGFVTNNEVQAIALAFLVSAGLTGAHLLPLGSGEVVIGKNFGSHKIIPSAITGTKWNDLNQDGRRDASEPGLAGWTIFLDTNGDGHLDTDEPSTLTNDVGNYSFTGLASGSYLVAELQQVGWEQTAPLSGIWEVTVGNGETLTGIDFGNQKLQPGSISGLKWDDVNGNGTFDLGESPSIGVTIYLDANNNGRLDDSELSVVTDTNGAYRFADLLPADYVVRQILGDGFEQTLPHNAVSLAQVLANLDANFAEVNSQIPNRYDFSNGVTGTNIFDGGNDMFDGGNYLYTNRGGPLSYTGGEVIDGNGRFAVNDAGANSRYFTRKQPGLFVMSAKNIDIAEFRISGGAADGLGKADGVVIPLGNGFTAFVKRVYGASQPSINHIILVPGDGSAQSSNSRWSRIALNAWRNGS